MKHTLRLLLIGAALVLGLTLVACATQTATQAPVAPVETQAPCPTAEPCAISGDTIPRYNSWAGSAHAKADAPAFTHWDADGKIPASCAKCHSDAGFQDYSGADTTAVGTIEAADFPTGKVITCNTCHTAELTKVAFPSGAEVDAGANNVCISCHQGVASKVQVDDAIKAAAAADDDTVSDKLAFINVHYLAAAIAKYGTEVKGGYEYDGKPYDTFWAHEAPMTNCTDCHRAHSLALNIDACGTCHEGVKTVEDVQKIRWMASTADFDGDSDVTEGIKGEVEGVQALLYTAIQAYAKDVVKAPLAYSAEAYPYWFADTNADGKADETEAVFANAYKSWTPRLVKATYNYQVSVKDPGGYAHGAKYLIELLYDSTADLNTKLATPVDLSKAHRIAAGHFAGSEEAFRHWDEEAAVPSGCVKCHTAAGLPQYIKEGVNTSQPASDGFECSTCHDGANQFAPYAVAEVTFPSGAKVSFGEGNVSNLCLQCHQGRESTVSINKVVAGKDADKVIEKQGFRNVHYFAAGATLFGTEAKGAYEYADKTYAGRFMHVESAATCKDCHDAHALTVKEEACKGCHNAEPKDIRMKLVADYDGDGDVKEGLKGEVDGLGEKLYAAIQAYAKDKLQKPIVYSAASYPYFFDDANANGKIDDGEAAYASWSPRLLEAAYNYQYYVKDPGAFAHNATYVMQFMYDSIKDLGGDVTKLVRP